MVAIDLSESGMTYYGGGGAGGDSSDEEGTRGRTTMCSWGGQHRGGGNVGCLAPISSSFTSSAARTPTTTTNTTASSSSSSSFGISSSVNDSKTTMDIKSWSTQHLRDLFGFGVSDSDKSVSTSNIGAAAGVNNDATTEKTTSIPSKSSTTSAAAVSGATSAADMNVPINEISEALNQLSFDQRQDAYHDVHGIIRDNDNDIMMDDDDLDGSFGGGRLPKEDPEMIRQRLRELEQYLLKAVYYTSTSSSSSSQSSSSVSGGAAALKLAVEQNPSYVQDKDFRLMFLRSEDYNAKLAATRVMNFFETKRELFGEEKLTKDITLDDLDDDDMYALKSGGFQILPIPDRSGRRIIYGPAKLERFRTGASFVSFVLFALIACLLFPSLVLRRRNSEGRLSSKHAGSCICDDDKLICPLTHLLP